MPESLQYTSLYYLADVHYYLGNLRSCVFFMPILLPALYPDGGRKAFCSVKILENANLSLFLCNAIGSLD